MADETCTHPETAKASVEIPGVYDGGLFWQCLVCGHRWHRWPEGHHLRARAQRYVEAGRG